MEKKSNAHFTYPPNVQELDLATLVSMYRDRGMPKKANPGHYFACAHTQRVIKEGKWWFGWYYSQQAWNSLLTKSSEGYPLTEVELNILGLAKTATEEPPKRNYVEQNVGILPKMAFMIVNDLKEFGFLSINEKKGLLITPRGDKALHGIAQRLYDQKFSPEMLVIKQANSLQPKMEQAQKKNDQPSLF